MGKAIVIAATLVILGVALLVWLSWARKQDERRDDKVAGRPVKGDLNARQERELDALVEEAQRILSGIGVNDAESWDDPEVIRISTRRAIGAWLVRYNNRKAKQ